MSNQTIPSSDGTIEAEKPFHPSHWSNRLTASFTNMDVLRAYHADAAFGAASVYRDYADVITTLTYGTGAMEQIDVVCPRLCNKNNKKCVIYIHGGYWQYGHFREHSMHLARPLVEEGLYFAAFGYRDDSKLMTLKELVFQIVKALERLNKFCTLKSIESLFISGSSAGAHLAAMMMFGQQWGLSAAVHQKISGYILFSGVYDLIPLLMTSINLPCFEMSDINTAKALSPKYLLADVKPDFHIPQVLLIYGDQESEWFCNESKNFLNLLQIKGVEAHCVEASNRDHFNLVSELHKPDDANIQLLINLVIAPAAPRETIGKQ